MLALLTTQHAIAWGSPPLLIALGTRVYTATALHYPLARVPACVSARKPVINATGPVSPFYSLSLRVAPVSNSFPLPPLLVNACVVSCEGEKKKGGQTFLHLFSACRPTLSLSSPTRAVCLRSAPLRLACPFLIPAIKTIIFL